MPYIFWCMSDWLRATSFSKPLISYLDWPGMRIIILVVRFYIGKPFPGFDEKHMQHEKMANVYGCLECFWFPWHCGSHYRHPLYPYQRAIQNFGDSETNSTEKDDWHWSKGDPWVMLRFDSFILPWLEGKPYRDFQLLRPTYYLRLHSLGLQWFHYFL